MCRKIGTQKLVYNFFQKGYRLPFIAARRDIAEAMRRPKCPDFLLTRYLKGSIKEVALNKLIGKLIQKWAIEEILDGTDMVFRQEIFATKTNKNSLVSPRVLPQF